MSINIVNFTFNKVTQTQEEHSKLLWEWESKPFGESPTNEDVDQDNKKFTLNLRFPGQYFDKETQTHYNINRDYNPVTGRYIQSDPIGFDGGVNGFAYVGGQPILYKDCNGLATCNQWVNHLTNLWDNYSTTYSLGYYMVNNLRAGESVLSGTLTGFKPILIQGGQNEAMTRHIYGHAGSLLVGGFVGHGVSYLNQAIDYFQRFQNGRTKTESEAEIADDIAGRSTAIILDLYGYGYYYSIWDWRSEQELIEQELTPKLRRIFCK